MKQNMTFQRKHFSHAQDLVIAVLGISQNRNYMTQIKRMVIVPSSF